MIELLLAGYASSCGPVRLIRQFAWSSQDNTMSWFRQAVLESRSMNRPLRLMIVVNFAVVLGLALWAFAAPAWIVIRELNDPGLRDGTVPQVGLSTSRLARAAVCELGA